MKNPYTNSDIDAKFQHIDDVFGLKLDSIMATLEEMKQDLKDTKAQATRTNGRVSKHDTNIQVIRAVGIFVLGICAYLAVQLLHNTNALSALTDNVQSTQLTNHL